MSSRVNSVKFIVIAFAYSVLFAERVLKLSLSIRQR